MEAVEADFNQRHIESFKQSDLTEVIKERFKGDQREYLLALKERDQARMDAVLVHQGLNDPKMRLEACQSMLKFSEERMSAMREAFEALYGFKLDPNHPDFYRREPLLDCMHYLLAGDRLSAAAMRLNWALEGRTKEWPGAIFYDHSGEANQAIIERYERLTGRDFWRRLRKKESADGISIMRSLVEDGELSDAEHMRDRLRGFGSDVRGALSLIRDKSRTKQKILGLKYAQRFKKFSLNPVRILRASLSSLRQCVSGEAGLKGIRGFPSAFRKANLVGRDLDTDLSSNLSGFDLIDAKLSRRGLPRTPAEKLSQVLEQDRLESTFVSRLTVDRWTRDGRRVRADIAALKTYYRDCIEGREPSKQELKRLDTLSKIAAQSIRSYRETKDTIANSVKNWGSFAALMYVSTIIKSFGVSSMLENYPLFAMCNFVVSFVSQWAPKQALLGKGFNRGEKLTILGLASVDALCAFINKLKPLRRLGIRGARKLTRPLVYGLRTAFKIGLKKSMKHGINSIWEVHKNRVSRHAEEAEKLKEINEQNLRGRRLELEARRKVSVAPALKKVVDLKPVWRKAFS